MAPKDAKDEFAVVDEMPKSARSRAHVDTVFDRIIVALLKDESKTIFYATNEQDKARNALRYAAFRQDRSAVTREGESNGVAGVFVQIKPRVSRVSKADA